MRATRKLAVPWLFAAVLLFATLPAFAQDEPAHPPQNADEQQADQTNNDVQKQNRTDQGPSAQPTPQTTAPSDLTLEQPTVNLATGQVLSKTRSPFRWGNLSLMSINLLQVYDSNYLFVKDNPPSAQAGAVQALFVYALKSSRSDFTIQYRPQVWISDQTQQFDYANHSVNFNTYRSLAPDWALNLSNSFQYTPDDGRLNQIGFSPDYTTGTSSQNPFLATGRKLLSNAAALSLEHTIDAHNQIEMGGRYQYIHVWEDPTVAATDPFSAATEEQDVGAHIGWAHTFRRDNSVGVQYSYDREFFQGFDSDAQLHGVMVNFSRRLRPSLLLRGGAGPTWLMPATPPGAVGKPAGTLTFQANATLYKTFRHSGITLSYSRNNSFTGSISDGLNDRFDGSYSQRFFRKVDVLVGGTYIRQGYSNTPYLYGSSGWSQVDYRLSRSWSVYGSYTYMTQNGRAAQYGPRQLIASGIRWSWDFEQGASFGK